MAVIRNLVVKISADISSLQQGLTDASKSLQKVSKELTSIGSSLTKSIIVPLTAAGAAIVKTSADFEQSMANAASVAGASSDELERMTKLAREMGASTVYSASDAADALYYMASAGYKVGQMEDSIQPILNLAAGTQNDLAATTDSVIAALNMYSLEASDAERVTNVYAAAIGNSMATMSKLTESMTYVGPVANSLGYSIEEVTGALGVLYNAGYEGSTAGTVLRQSLVNLMNPTKAALDIFNELGLAYEDLNPATNDFATIVDRLGEAGLSTAQAMEIFGARGGPGMLALLNEGGDAIRDMTGLITGTSAATDMAAKQLDTLSGQWKILKSQLQEVALQFGDVLIPVIRDFLAKYITPLVEKLLSLSDEERLQIVKIAAIAAAIGPLLLAAGKVTGALSTLLKILPSLLSSTTLIIAGIAALAAGFIDCYKNSEEFRDKVNGAFESIKQKVSPIVSRITDICKDAISGIKAFWESNGEGVLSAIVDGISFCLEIVIGAFDSVLKAAEAVWPVVRGIVEGCFSGIASFIEGSGSQILETVSSVFNFVKQIVDTVVAVIGDALARFSAFLAPIGESLGELLGKILNEALELLKALEPMLNSLMNIIGAVLTVALGVIDGIISALGPFIEFVTNAVGVVTDILGMLMALLRGDFPDAFTHAQKVAEGVFNAIKSLVETVWNFIKGIISGIITVAEECGVDVEGIVNSIVSTVTSLVSNLAEGIKTALNKIKEISQTVWNAVSSVAVSAWNKVSDVTSTAFTKITTAFQNGKTTLTNLWNSLTTAIQNAWEKVCSLITDTANNLVKAISNMVTKIREFFSQCFSGIQSGVNNLFSLVSSLANTLGSVFSSLVSSAYSWGSNMMSNLISGIKSMFSRLKNAVSSAADVVSDYLGFHSPTKEGPGSYADEWMPNMIEMFKEGIFSSLPSLADAASAIAQTLNPARSYTQAVGPGTSPFGDLLNGYLSATSEAGGSDTGGDIILQIDGQTFARLIAPKLTREYNRNGIRLQEV